ncbi:MAG: glycerol-3-phosphate 1-O-acyltransferase PlsY [Dehalococcoidia bacterium]
MVLQYGAVFLLAYLLGAIPFGVIIGRLFGGVDIREYGSGKMGATNVMRTAGICPGIVVFLTDLAKAVGAVLLARLILGTEVAAVGAALAAIAGHDWPVYLKFRGGRGVTTSLGGLLALSWPLALLAFGLGVVVIALFRYVSLGSMVGSVGLALIVLVLVALGWPHVELLVYTALVAAAIVIQHRDNIARLRAGQERKLGQGAERRV